VKSINGQPTAAVYGSATTTNGAPPVTVACSPVSGSVFQIGSTTVTCTATDALQRTDSCTFTVTVTPPPMISLTRFLAFGDSMTAGELFDMTDAFRPLRVHPELSYPTDLQVALVSRYTAQTITVSNAGRSGEGLVSDNAPRRLSDVLARGQYDVVLLMEGANDIASRDSRDTPPAIAALRAMVQDAKRRGLRPFLGTLPPETGLAWTLVEPFNTQLKAMASAENVPVADVFAAFNGDFSLLAGDGLHPNVNGYQRIADTFFAVIKQNLELPTMMPNFMRTPPAFVPPSRRL
jgi:lysophospholipase L1-like esterase